jgi:hypothetical protein
MENRSKSSLSSNTMSALSRPAKQASESTTPQTNTEPTGNPARPLQKSVRIYKAEELDHEALAAQTKVILGQVAFGWQIEIGAAALCGEDVIVDVGTGCGKSLPFSIPLILHETDVVLRVTPLTALMIDQVSTAIVMISCKQSFSPSQAASAKLRTVAVCSETLAKYGAKVLYEVRTLLVSRFSILIPISAHPFG